MVGDVELEARWTLKEYDVNFDSDGGTSVQNQTVKHGEKVTKPADPSKEGYNFKGWFVEGGTSAYSFDTSVTGPLGLKAHWELKKYTVTFYEADGTTVLDSHEYEYGTPQGSIRTPDPSERSGYTFQYWTVEKPDTEGLFAEKPAEFILDSGLKSNVEVYPYYRNMYEIILKSGTVLFDGMIHLRFHYDITAYAEDERNSTYVVFMDGNTELARQALSAGDGADSDKRYVCPVPAWKYTNSIIAKVIKEGKNVPVKTASGKECTEGFEYSLQTYAKRLSVNGSTKTMRDLANALKDYGTAAQIYFKRGDYSSLVVDAGVTNVSLEKMGPPTAASGTKPAGVGTVTVNVDFDSDNSLMVYYTLAAGKTKKDYVFKLDGTIVNNPAVTEDNRIKLIVPCIDSNKLDVVHVFEVTDGTNSFTITSSPLMYARRMAERGSSDSMKNLAKALYLYSVAAKAYFGTP